MADASAEANATIGGLLAAASSRGADDRALCFGGETLTYAALHGLVERLAGDLASAAGGPDLHGARIAVIAPNSPLLVGALFAAWRLGAVAVPLNARLREHELSAILGDAEPALIVSVRDHLGYAFTGLLPRLVGDLRSVRASLFADLDGAIAPVSTAKRHGVTSDEAARAGGMGPQIAAVLYTSGTTGTPKGVLVTHGREVATARELASVLALSSDDGVALIVPISHAFGLTCLVTTIAAGARAILVESTTTNRPLLAAMDEHAATVLHGSPALFSALLTSRAEGLAGVRGGFVAGAPSSPELQERLDDLGVLNLYGLTEAGAVACCRRDDPPERRRSTAGRPLPGTEVRLVENELEVRGPGVTPGYYRRPDETAAVFDGGWLKTGDLAEIDDGYIRIAGRRKELVHIAGFNVFPAEVEAVLLSHPDVVQAAVVGVEDERMGETLRAFVVPRPGSDLTPGILLGFARARIAGYKLPYAIRLVPDLPLLPSGKPDRRALAAR